MLSPSNCFVCIGMLAIRVRSLLMSLVSAAIASNLRVGDTREEFCSLSFVICFEPGVACSFSNGGCMVIFVCCVWLLVVGVFDRVSMLCDCVCAGVVRISLSLNIASASSCIFVCMAILGDRCPSPCSCRQYASRVCTQWSMEHVGSMSPFACSHGCCWQSGHAQWNEAWYFLALSSFMPAFFLEKYLKTAR